MRQLRILEVLLAPMIGGAEVLSSQLSFEWEKQGHEVSFATLDSSPSSDQERLFATIIGKDFENASSLAPQRVRRMRRVARLVGMHRVIAAGGYDVIHSHTLLPSYYGRVAALSVRHRPVVVTTFHSQSALAEFGPFLNKHVERVLLKQTDAFTAVSSMAASEYDQLFPAMRGRIHHIPNGISVQTSKRTKTLEKPVSFVSISRLIPSKGLATLITGFDQYVQSVNPDAKLTIYGPFLSKQYEAEIMQTWRSLSCPYRVRFAGPTADVSKVLDESDVFISASRHEAHPIAVLEAMAVGIPVLASYIPAHFQYVNRFNLDGELLFTADSSADLARSLNHLQTNWTRITSDAAVAASEVNEQFSIERCARRYSELFENLLTQRTAQERRRN